LAGVPDCIYATSASLGRFGLHAWAHWQPLQARPRARDEAPTCPRTGLLSLHSSASVVNSHSVFLLDRGPWD
jgi:hypothetical protein